MCWGRGEGGGRSPSRLIKGPVNWHRPSVIKGFGGGKDHHGLASEGRLLGGGDLARLPRTSQGVGEEPLFLAGAMSRQARSRGTGPRTQGGAGAVGGKMGFRAGGEAADGSSSSPAGLGLHLRPQLLPLCPGHGLRPAAAQGQQEGWKRGVPRQAGLLHPLLCLYLTVQPRPQAPALPHPRPGESPPSFPTWRNVPPQILRGLQGCGKHPADCFLRIHLLGFYWVLSTMLERKELSPFS